MSKIKRKPRVTSVKFTVKMSLEIGCDPDTVFNWLLEAGYTKLEARDLIQGIE